MNIKKSILAAFLARCPLQKPPLGGMGVLLLLVFTLAACHDPEDPVTDRSATEESLGDHFLNPDNPAQGPDWTYTPNADDYRTMTITLRLPDNLAAGADSADRLTALAADYSVCGMAQTDADDSALYYLTVGAPRCESQSVVIAYYSARKHAIYVSADTYTFIPDENIGTYLTPLVPSFRYSGK